MPMLVRSLPPGRVVGGGNYLILRAKSGFRGTRADQSVRPIGVNLTAGKHAEDWRSQADFPVPVHAHGPRTLPRSPFTSAGTLPISPNVWGQFSDNATFLA